MSERKSKQKVKGVAFNEDNPRDMELLKYAESQGSFSYYVKQLILLDKTSNVNWGDENTQFKKVVESKPVEEEPEVTLDDLDNDMIG